ncbi:MAG TPA: polyprenyl synthetase family protein [Myxococcota bacterium]|jgi:geranylgeranyl pyrophosphate synthase|nr:polyprenyl synthetase family protein [Myxococcota bacterium]
MTVHGLTDAAPADADARDRFGAMRERYLGRILALAEEVVRGASPPGSALAAMCDYHMETGGKRLRALLPLLVADALGTDPAALVPFGAACEMLHNATLVHDDVQDGDAMRRGRPTVWRRWGVPQAINLGDAMFYYTLLLVQRVEAPAALREAAARRVLVDTLRIIDGQEREFALKRAARPALDDYFAMVEGKTSGLFAIPMAGAAALCGAAPALVEALEESARQMGVLFQLQDDVLDLYGEKGRETRGSDVGEGKRSVLAVHALQTAPEAEARWLQAVLDKERACTTEEDVDEVTALFERAGSLRFALAEMARRREGALAPAALAEHARLRALVGGMCDVFLEPIRPLLAPDGTVN